MSFRILVAAVTLAVFAAAAKSHDNPNPPIWPESVYVFDPSSPGITANDVGKVFSLNGGHAPSLNGQFSPLRFALLFKPGSHAVDVNVGTFVFLWHCRVHPHCVILGYYTSVYGLGIHPTDTKIRNVISENGWVIPTLSSLSLL